MSSPALGWSAARSTRVASVRFGVSVHDGNSRSIGQAERRGELAQLGESVGLAREVRVRQLGDDVARSELGARLEEAQVVAGAVSRGESRELDVEDLDAGRREVRLGGPHECRVVGQRVVGLLRGDLRHPQPHVAVAGGGRGIDELGR